jgi:hypothetical protein
MAKLENKIEATKINISYVNKLELKWNLTEK